MQLQALKQRLAEYRAGKQQHLNNALATDGAIQALSALIAEEEAELLKKAEQPTPEVPCTEQPPEQS